MIFGEKQIRLRDGKEYTFKTPSMDDAAQCANFIYRACSQTPYMRRSKEDGVPSLGDETRWLSNHRNNPNSCLVAAYDKEGEQIGSAHISISPYAKSKHTAVVGAVVDIKHTGLGMGSALFNILFDIAKQKGITIITVNVVSVNKQAMALYKKFGFKQVGLVEGMYVDSDGEVYDIAIMQVKLQ